MSVVTFVYADDWEGVYVDDKLLSQAHSLDGYTVVELLWQAGIQVSCVFSEEAGEWLYDEGYLPDTLQEFMEKNKT